MSFTHLAGFLRHLEKRGDLRRVGVLGRAVQPHDGLEVALFGPFSFGIGLRQPVAGFGVSCLRQALELLQGDLIGQASLPIGRGGAKRGEGTQQRAEDREGQPEAPAGAGNAKALQDFLG